MSSCPQCGADSLVRLGESETEGRIEPATAGPADETSPVRYRCLACDHEWTYEENSGR